MVNEMSVGLLAQPLRLPGRHRKPQPGGLHVLLPGRNFGRFDPPRLEPFGRVRRSPALSRTNVDEYPYMPGHSRSPAAIASNLARWRPWAGNTRPAADAGTRTTATRSRTTCRWTKGRHSMKFGFVTERNAKTEPGSATYTGVYDFGHSGDNPLSTGNGYANALLGYFTRYEERTNRIDRERRHWQTDFYAQDTWRMTSRMTLDYGLRVAHHGAIYEVEGHELGVRSGVVRSDEGAGVLRAVLHDRCQRNAGVRGCEPPGEESADREKSWRTPTRAPRCRARAVSATGCSEEGFPGKKDGWYYDMPVLLLGTARRVRLGFDRRRQDRHPSRRRHLLQLPQSGPVRDSTAAR